MARADHGNASSAAGVLFGAGFGALVEHAMRARPLLDGMLLVGAILVITAAFVLLWRHALRTLIATLLVGFGAFNVIEGVVDHFLLGVHHVNELAPPETWLRWDVGFVAGGALLVVAGWALKRTPRAVRERKPAMERRRRPSPWRPGDRRRTAAN